MSLLEGREYAISAGGSLSNTLVALVRLGDASSRLGGEPRLRVGMAGLLGADPLGEFYASQVGTLVGWLKLFKGWLHLLFWSLSRAGPPVHMLALRSLAFHAR